MDVNTLMKLMTSANSTNAISQKTDASADQVASIVNNIMPMLLKGATAQATNKNTASSFNTALEKHSTRDTSDLGKFLGGVDTADGAKIFEHLLGGNSAASIQTAAKASGTSAKDVEKVMAMISPLLMSVLGQQQKKHGNASGGLMAALLGGAVNNVLGGSASGIIGSVLGGGSQKKDGIDAGDVLNLVGKLLK